MKRKKQGPARKIYSYAFKKEVVLEYDNEMKQTSLFIILLFLLGCNNDKTSKNNLEQSKDTLVENNILKQDIYSGNLVLKLKQDSSCKSVKYPHGNIGVASFALMDSNRIAILCEESRLIKIYLNIHHYT